MEVYLLIDHVLVLFVIGCIITAGFSLDVKILGMSFHWSIKGILDLFKKKKQ